MAELNDAPFAEIKYDIVFDDRVLEVLGTGGVKTAIEAYIKKYNELLANSTYFKKGVLNYYNAQAIARNLVTTVFSPPSTR